MISDWNRIDVLYGFKAVMPEGRHVVIPKIQMETFSTTDLIRAARTSKELLKGMKAMNKIARRHNRER
jgi:hypothetical protein